MKTQTSQHYKDLPAIPFRLPQTFKLGSADKEHPKPGSKTIPDDSYHVRDIVAKFSQGIDPSISRLGNYSDDPDDHDQPDIAKLGRSDIADLQAFNQRLAKRRKELLDEIEQIQKQNKEGLKNDDSTTKKPDTKMVDLRHDTETKKKEGTQDVSSSINPDNLKQGFKEK